MLMIVAHSRNYIIYYLLICTNIVQMVTNYYVYLNYKKPRNLKMWAFQKDSAILAVIEAEHEVN